MQTPGDYLRSKNINPKYVKYGLVTIGVIVAGVIISKQIAKFFGKGYTKVDQHNVAGLTTITKDDAKSIADRLWNHINEMFFISFESGIKPFFDGYPNLTKADLTMVYNAFGKRNNGFPFYTEGDLYFWLDRKVKVGVAECKEFFGI